MEELGHWAWFKVSFSLGVPPGETLETDPALFFKWLIDETPKFVDEVTVQPAVLKTAPFE